MTPAVPLFPTFGKKKWGKILQSYFFSYLGGEVAAEFEFLQCQCHGVGPEEEDEGHEGQIRHKFTGFPH